MKDSGNLPHEIPAMPHVLCIAMKEQQHLVTFRNFSLILKYYLPSMAHSLPLGVIFDL
jgi:hypothetical protein